MRIHQRLLLSNSHHLARSMPNSSDRPEVRHYTFPRILPTLPRRRRIHSMARSKQAVRTRDRGFRRGNRLKLSIIVGDRFDFQFRSLRWSEIPIGGIYRLRYLISITYDQQRGSLSFETRAVGSGDFRPAPDSRQTTTWWLDHSITRSLDDSITRWLDNSLFPIIFTITTMTMSY